MVVNIAIIFAVAALLEIGAWITPAGAAAGAAAIAKRLILLLFFLLFSYIP